MARRGASAQILRIQQAIQFDPKAWTPRFDAHFRRRLGADAPGAGWSTAEYGRRQVDFAGGKRVDLEHCFHDVAEVHRLLHRGQTEHAEAFTRQARKAIEPVMLDEGGWALVRAGAGLLELRSTARVRRGGAHPVEVAAGVAYEEGREGAPKQSPNGGGGPGDAGG